MTTVSHHVKQNTPLTWVTYLFHPSWVGGLAVLLTIYLRGEATLVEAAGWVALMFFIATIPLLLSAVIHKQMNASPSGRFGHRYEQYIISAIAVIVLLVVVTVTEAPPIFISIMYAAGLTTLVGALINHFMTPISRYALVMAGSAAILFVASIPLSIVGSLIALLVGWVRVQVGHHTWPQVILGYAVTGICVVVTFMLTL